MRFRGIFLVGLLALIWAVRSDLNAQPETQRTPLPAKERILRDLAENVIVPASSELERKCAALLKATAKLEAEPSDDILAVVRACWKEVAIAVAQFECFKRGPVLDVRYAPAFFFPARSISIERAIKSVDTISEGTIAELSVAAKGVWAIEYLLYPPPDAAAELIRGPSTAARRRFLHLIAGELAAKTSTLASEWREPRSASAQAFCDGGQASVNAMVNQLAWTIRTNEDRLRAMAISSVQKDTLGVPSGLARRMIHASLEGSRRMYSSDQGFGLDDWLRHIGAPVALPFEAKFKALLEATDALAQEQDSPKDRAAEAKLAFEACRELERLIKVDLVSALGVTLTFGPADGD